MKCYFPLRKTTTDTENVGMPILPLNSPRWGISIKLIAITGCALFKQIRLVSYSNHICGNSSTYGRVELCLLPTHPTRCIRLKLWTKPAATATFPTRRVSVVLRAKTFRYGKSTDILTPSKLVWKMIGCVWGVSRSDYPVKNIFSICSHVILLLLPKCGLGVF